MINIPVQSVHSYGLGMSWASVEEEELLEREEFGETENKVMEEVENYLVKRERMKEDIGSVMDIREQSNEGGNSITKPLKERDTADVDDIPQDNSFNKLERLQSDDQLCLSPTKIILAFVVLLLILVLALLFSCVLWMKARESLITTHHPHPCMRRQHLVQTRTQHCILGFVFIKRK